MADLKWFYSFKAHYKKLVVPFPQTNFISGTNKLNKGDVFGFFDMLQKIVDENHVDF